MSLTPNFQNRDFTTRMVSAGLDFNVQSFGWNAIGGPVQAEIGVVGGQYQLWELLNWLRSPVEINDEIGNPVWWGYINQVEIKQQAISFGVSLDDMANRVRVVYSKMNDGGSDTGTPGTTDWTTDALSLDTYGTKDLYYSAQSATMGQATAIRDIVLNERKYPIPVIDFSASSGELSATLSCKGWWDTLDWRRVSYGGTAASTSTGVITNLLTKNAQFITGVEVDDTGGTVSSYREGYLSMQSEVEDFLKTGPVSGRRLLARVNKDRRVRIYQEPDKSAITYWVDTNGVVYDLVGRPVSPWLLRPGVWCALKDVVPANVNATYIGAPSPFFIEEINLEGSFGAQDRSGMNWLLPGLKPKSSGGGGGNDNWVPEWYGPWKPGTPYGGDNRIVISTRSTDGNSSLDGWTK